MRNFVIWPLNIFPCQESSLRYSPTPLTPYWVESKWDPIQCTKSNSWPWNRGGWRVRLESCLWSAQTLSAAPSWSLGHQLCPNILVLGFVHGYVLFNVIFVSWSGKERSGWSRSRQFDFRLTVWRSKVGLRVVRGRYAYQIG